MSDAPVAPLVIREAGPSDLSAIAEFNRLLALETEAKVLDPDVLAAASPRPWRTPIESATGSRQSPAPSTWPAKLRSLASGATGATAGSGGSRASTSPSPIAGKGIFRALYRHIRESALAQPDVIGLRLYVEDANERAQKTYQSLGMKPGGYSVYQDLWIGRGPQT